MSKTKDEFAKRVQTLRKVYEQIRKTNNYQAINDARRDYHRAFDAFMDCEKESTQ